MLFRHMPNRIVKFVRMFVASLGSRQYIVLRNTVIVLARIIEYFPQDSRAADEIVGKVASLITAERREDIKTMAMNYASKLARKKGSI